MPLRFHRRAVVLVLVFGALALLGTATFAALLTGSFEILALAPFSLLLWILIFVWVAARLARRSREHEKE